MREILFKAKRIDNGEWVEGYLFDNGFGGKEKRYYHQSCAVWSVFTEKRKEERENE